MDSETAPPFRKFLDPPLNTECTDVWFRHTDIVEGEIWEDLIASKMRFWRGIEKIRDRE